MRLLLPTILAALVTPLQALAAGPAGPAGARILGEWLGSSICAHPASTPNCEDETVRYVFRDSKRTPGNYHLVAERLENGRYHKMYEMEFEYSEFTAEWSHVSRSPGCPQCRWWYRFDHSALVGGATDSAGGPQRKVTALRLR
jgi:hypothetical protein